MSDIAITERQQYWLDHNHRWPKRLQPFRDPARGGRVSASLRGPALTG